VGPRRSPPERGVHGTLTVGLEAPSGTELAAPVFAQFRAQHPGVAIPFRKTGLTEPLDLLRSGGADVAVTNAPGDEDGFEEEPLVHAETVVSAMARTIGWRAAPR
jgi:DNA-binding transcriptional LysR family regulator